MKTIFTFKYILRSHIVKPNQPVLAIFFTIVTHCLPKEKATGVLAALLSIFAKSYFNNIIFRVAACSPYVRR